MPGDAARALGRRALRRPLYFCDDVYSLQVNCVAISPDGRRVVSASEDNTLKVWDIETGECVATLEGHSSHVRCGVHCTFVMMCLRRVVGHLRCRVSGRAARRVCVGRQDAQGLGRGDREMRGDAERALELCALRRPLYFCDDLASS